MTSRLITNSIFSFISSSEHFSTCTMFRKRIIAILQLNNSNDKEQNFQTCHELIKKAKDRGAKMAFLPEGFDYIGNSKEETIALAEDLAGPLVARYKSVALGLGIWLSLGGFHEKARGSSPPKIHNTHIIINERGEVVTTYRKAHLFDVSIPDRGIELLESSYIEAGKEIVPPVNTPIGKVGLAICYDLRFPEFSRYLTSSGAEILTFPSAFTVNTGLAHWEPLLRARAIENQCYVVAAAQTGTHGSQRSTYGHAMVLDPWGAIIAQCSEGVGIALAEIDLQYLEKVNKNMPIDSQRRPDLYGLPCVTAEGKELTSNDTTFQFGHLTINGSTVFLKTELSLAIVNKKCIVPGHVLVIPQRVTPSLRGLTPSEVRDLFLTVQKVQGVLERIHGATSSTIAIQDGVDAGQSIQHVHVHVLPRKPGDLKNNDDIYSMLEHHDKEVEKGDSVKWRNDAEMAKEAQHIRDILNKSSPQK